jgi:hypothetical protein
MLVAEKEPKYWKKFMIAIFILIVIEILIQIKMKC